LWLVLYSNINFFGEIGYRFTNTDYLDDVSTTYVNQEEMMTGSQQKSAELSFRQVNGPFPGAGATRGNPKVNDWYFISGFKLLFRLGNDR
jgi:hypothetical protein